MKASDDVLRETEHSEGSNPRSNINNELCKNIKRIRNAFPLTPDGMNMDKIKIDKESLSYITRRNEAIKISQIIYRHIEKCGIKPEDGYITDATAGCGGDTISFAKKFKRVTAIEINSERTEYLKSNIKTYGLHNVKVICGDCMDIIDKIKTQNVIFIDPPWGGRDYKKKSNLRLKLSGVTIKDICIKLLQPKICDMIVLKLPTNYDLLSLIKKLRKHNFKDIYIHNLDKMDIFVVYNNPQ